MSHHPRRRAARRRNRPHHQSRRADRRARLALLLLAGLLVGTGATGAEAAKRTTGAPTVTFSVIDVGSGGCGSRPDVEDHLIIKHGTWLNLVNDTGASASVDTGRRQAIAIPDGGGVAVKLARGVHTISLVPDCGAVVALAVTIEVVQAREMPDNVEAPTGASPAPPEAPGAPPAEPADQATDPSGSAGSGGGGTAATAAPTPSSDPEGGDQTGGDETGGDESGGDEAVGEEPDGATGGDAGGAGGSPATRAGGPLADDIDGVIAVRVLGGGEFERLILDSDPAAKGGNMLAVIAAICVFGVTAAIIRAILTQRARRTLRA